MMFDESLHDKAMEEIKKLTIEDIILPNEDGVLDCVEVEEVQRLVIDFIDKSKDKTFDSVCSLLDEEIERKNNNEFARRKGMMDKKVYFVCDVCGLELHDDEVEGGIRDYPDEIECTFCLNGVLRKRRRIEGGKE